MIFKNKISITSIPRANAEHSNAPCWVPIIRAINIEEVREAIVLGHPPIDIVYEECRPKILLDSGKYIPTDKFSVFSNGLVMEGSTPIAIFDNYKGRAFDPIPCKDIKKH